ncbi:DUF6679 family protein [Leptolyngbya sp. BC1307]|uniref:DUF6679 family protein n=1 Tax=Leptolyngbya sp. BC1307 TaxID=2029589 RepID=UPI000EFAA07E|nr:DUF6679 family protein [Leptolyngbya sp. BC1307]
MLQRKIYQLSCEGREVQIFLRDQQRWIESATISGIEGDLVTLRYETEDEDEICAWEEMVRIESIGAVSQKLASVPKGHIELPLTNDCPDAEQMHDKRDR